MSAAQRVRRAWEGGKAGSPGVGKTSVVEMVARELTGSPLAVESFNGREVIVELVREWTKNPACGPTE